MKISIESLGKIGRRIAIEREKANVGEALMASLKFDGLEIQREVIEALLSTQATRVFNELGQPFAGVDLGLTGREFRVVGTIGARESEPTLRLVDAALESVVIRLRENGGMMSGKLSWKARGDEAEDVETLLSREVQVKWDVMDSGQQEFELTPGTKSVADSQQSLDIVAGAIKKARQRKPKTVPKPDEPPSPGESHG